MSYDRYQFFKVNGIMNIVPFINIPKKNTDIYIYYERGKTRFDLLSYEFYKDCDFGWLILQANPELPPYEFMIPNNTQIRIPYPLETTLLEYEENLKKYNDLNKSESYE